MPGARSVTTPSTARCPLRGPRAGCGSGRHYDAEEPGTASAAFRANLEARAFGRLAWSLGVPIFPISAAHRFAPCTP